MAQSEGKKPASRENVNQQGENVLEESQKEIKKENFYFVVDTLDYRSKFGHRFLVKWRGYSHDHNTWEPLSCFFLGDGVVNDVFEAYCKHHNLSDVLVVAKERSAKLEGK